MVLARPERAKTLKTKFGMFARLGLVSSLALALPLTGCRKVVKLAAVANKSRKLLEEKEEIGPATGPYAPSPDDKRNGFFSARERPRGPGTITPMRSEPGGVRGKIYSTAEKHKVVRNGVEGMEIITSFNVENHAGEPVTVAAYFFNGLHEPMEDEDGEYATAGGQIATSVSATPGYAYTDYEDLVLFIPYSQFHHEGDWVHFVEYDLLIHSRKKGGFLATRKGDRFYLRSGTLAEDVNIVDMSGQSSSLEDNQKKERKKAEAKARKERDAARARRAKETR